MRTGHMKEPAKRCRICDRIITNGSFCTPCITKEAQIRNDARRYG